MKTRDNAISSFEGVIVKPPKKYSWLEDMLHVFHGNINVYGDSTKWKMDLPYFYNERTTMSILSGAAWMSGFACLQDYATRKNDPTRRGPSTKIGWGDLYVRCPATRREAAFEAKQIFPNVGKNFSLADSKALAKGMENALVDARQSLDAKMRFAVLFVTPRFRADQWVKAKMENKLSEMVNDAQLHASQFNAKLLGWCFPSEARKLPFESRAAKTTMFYYPGVITILVPV